MCSCPNNILYNPSSKAHGGVNNNYGAIQEPIAELEETEDEYDSEGSDSPLIDANARCAASSQAKINDTKGYSNGTVEGMEKATPPTNKGEKGDAKSNLWAVISTVHTASFFSAVILSGMGAGVIDTFLFIRYGCLHTWAIHKQTRGSVGVEPVFFWASSRDESIPPCNRLEHEC